LCQTPNIKNILKNIKEKAYMIG